MNPCFKLEETIIYYFKAEMQRSLLKFGQFRLFFLETMKRKEETKCEGIT